MYHQMDIIDTMDVSLWVKNSGVGRKTQTNKQKQTSIHQYDAKYVSLWNRILNFNQEKKSLIPISVEPPYKFVYFKPYLREQQTNNVLISYAFIHKNSRSFYRMEIYIIRDTPDQKKGV